ncbi:hypothetical protein QE418_003385 [Microbacterium testaceum]|uniref:SAP domain-containing protein n=1 Tax=Microbacterium TaxID=33882 RepID=UPI002780C0B2|nr:MULTISPECIES: SAP domain-containing protein [Microbacterium]MDQ1113937.1 hypothetical protein [Microbacterium testaceum]MDR6098956.1 hypothetical protein [Microbacterium sp. SORGH_AS_0454]
MSEKLRKITAGIVHLLHNGRPVTLRAGDLVPDWATITNPRLIGDVADGTPATSPEGGGEGTPPTGGQQQTPPVAPAPAKSNDTVEVSEKLKSDALRKIAGDLGIDTSGTKPQLVERILAKRAADAEAAADAAEAASAADAGGGSPDEGREALEERARALSIADFDENTTDEELAALIEDAEE